MARALAARAGAGARELETALFARKDAERRVGAPAGAAVRDGNRAGTPARGNCLADGNRSVSPTRPQAWRKAAQPIPHAYLGHKQATRGPAASGQRREAERVCVSASATLVIGAPSTQHARHGQAPANSLYQQPVDSRHTSYSRAETRTRRNVTYRRRRWQALTGLQSMQPSTTLESCCTCRDTVQPRRAPLPATPYPLSPLPPYPLQPYTKQQPARTARARHLLATAPQPPPHIGRSRPPKAPSPPHASQLAARRAVPPARGHAHAAAAALHAPRLAAHGVPQHQLRPPHPGTAVHHKRVAWEGVAGRGAELWAVSFRARTGGPARVWAGPKHGTAHHPRVEFGASRGGGRCVFCGACTSGGGRAACPRGGFVLKWKPFPSQKSRG